MTPDITILTDEITQPEYASRTYRINFNNSNISGYVDDLDSLKQAIYLILSTERYEYIIYSWDYGVELLDLIGKPLPYIMSELPRRIKEALLVDNRVTDVTDFTFDRKGTKLQTSFTVVSDVGNISTELEVTV